MSKIWRFEVDSTNTLAGVDMTSTLHYQTNVSGIDSDASASTVLDELLQHFSASAHSLSKWRDAAYSVTTFTECRVREEVEWWNHEIGATASEIINGAGNLTSIGSNVTPPEMAPWIKLGTGTASRSARGGVHPPGPFSALVLASSGDFSSGTTLWTKLGDLGAAIIDALEDVFGTSGTSDILPVIYSPTRRRRGDTPYTFQLEHYAVTPRPRWIRTRTS